MTLQPEHHNIGYLLNKATLGLKRKLSERLEAHGITTAQWSVLRDLASQDQLSLEERQVTPAQIAARLQTDRPTLSGILDRLQKKKLVRIRANPRDRRSQLAELTEEAQQLLPAMEQESRLVLQQALKHMSEEDNARLQAALIFIIRNMNEREETL